VRGRRRRVDIDEDPADVLGSVDRDDGRREARQQRGDDRNRIPGQTHQASETRVSRRPLWQAAVHTASREAVVHSRPCDERLRAPRARPPHLGLARDEAEFPRRAAHSHKNRHPRCRAVESDRTSWGSGDRPSKTPALLLQNRVATPSRQDQPWSTSGGRLRHTVGRSARELNLSPSSRPVRTDSDRKPDAQFQTISSSKTRYLGIAPATERPADVSFLAISDISKVRSGSPGGL
jgi:hypothetical protein